MYLQKVTAIRSECEEIEITLADNGNMAAFSIVPMQMCNQLNSFEKASGYYTEDFIQYPLFSEQF